MSKAGQLLSQLGINEAKTDQWNHTTADGARAIEYIDNKGSGNTYYIADLGQQNMQAWADGFENQMEQGKIGSFEEFIKYWDKYSGGQRPTEAEYNYLKNKK